MDALPAERPIGGLRTRRLARLPKQRRTKHHETPNAMNHTPHSLGVAPAWLQELVWDLLNCNAFRITGSREDRIEGGVARLRERLFDWYGREAAKGRHHTQVRKLIPATFGTASNKKFALYGAEANGFLAFSSFLLDAFGEHLGPRHKFHRAASNSLINIVESIRQYPKIYPPAAAQRFCNDVKEHLWAVRRLRIAYRPKHHLLIEQAGRMLLNLKSLRANVKQVWGRGPRTEQAGGPVLRQFCVKCGVSRNDLQKDTHSWQPWLARRLDRRISELPA